MAQEHVLKRKSTAERVVDHEETLRIGEGSLTV